MSGWSQSAMVIFDLVLVFFGGRFSLCLIRHWGSANGVSSSSDEYF